MGKVAGRFARVEPRRPARAFVLGLLADLPRKNCWTIAEHAGNAGPAGMQHLLSRARWDADRVRDDLRDFVVEHLGDEDAVLVVDETGDLKKGTASVGVQRQYTGTAGRIENSQVAVYLLYASAAGHAAIDRRLSIPRSWTQDPQRCHSVGIPDDLRSATRPALATEMIAQALDAGVRSRWVTGDEVYGGDPHLTALVKVAGRRWTVEETFQAAKSLAGLDEHQVRRWVSWHRWTTLAMLAHAFLAVTAAIERATTTTTPELSPLTCNEIQKLFAALLAPARDLAHRLHCSAWRRRHQARSRTSHYQRQATQQP